ncbi:unnamed protein product [Trichobilharzia szidati]|nr:unnamed protein product [Trichobilharzia szidati]
MITSWECLAKLLVPCEILIVIKLLFCLVSFSDFYLSLSSLPSILNEVILSSPITVFSLFLLMNWASYYAYLIVYIIISSSSVYSDVYKLFHFGISYQVPLTLDNIELFTYTYTSTLYFLRLLNTDESSFGIISCLLMFCSLRLHRFAVCWLTLRLSNNPFIRLMLDTHLLFSLAAYGLYLLWLFSMCFYFASYILTGMTTLMPNTILCTSIFLLLVHVHLILTDVKLFILPMKINLQYNKTISSLFLSIEIINFILILAYTSWKFYLSETSLLHLGYAEISSHVIFLTVIFCLLYIYEKLLPLIQLEFFGIDNTTTTKISSSSSCSISSMLSSNYCGLCSLPLFRPIILPSSVTSNSNNDCQHLLHTECLKVLELISFPCLRCCADSCTFLQDNNNVVSEGFDSYIAYSGDSNTSSFFEDSSTSSSVYDDKDVDLSVYLNLDQLNGGKIGRTLRRLDGSGSSSSSLSVSSSLSSSIQYPASMMSDSRHWSYDHYLNYDSDISNL